ncbi:molybdate transport system substrate-binding protein [Dethiosulfatibacter aminovorans DSM 17477]|uniref:Molybdate transport system substrate-binding protein n=1 Tax=Dethiosulfatibacter aminovorans DSM 17477 TaxID=1121476 RepID=A0A1M6ABY0_9FIRM|nr:molybdate ABC transporter substrate-binding protein [Dethiosulfatibacter aminovorans]SHI33898.1 molybdate transport system substrate-binding protein [Dethiosulfatibacter aminovorans DSM 17477]
MEKFTKFICSIATLFLLLTVSACTSGSSTGSQTEGNQQTEEIQLADASTEETSLLVYSGAGLKKPMAEIGEMFEDETGIMVEYIFGGSAQLLSQIEISGKGDVFISGSMDSYNSADNKGLVLPCLQVAYHVPVIGVPEGNPANIQSLEDMTKQGVKIVLGDEKANAVGKAAQRIITKTGLTGINDNVVAKTATVNELAIHLEMEDADASIITKDLASHMEGIEIIEIPVELNSIEIIPVCTLTSSENTGVSNEFIEFVSSGKGKAIFEKYGFPAVEND